MDYREKLARDQRKGAVGLPFDPYMQEESEWTSPRMQHDSAIMVHRHNLESEHGIVLPIEQGGANGDPLPVIPRNVVRFDQPEDEMEALHQWLAGLPDVDMPDAHFRAAWKWLRKRGVDHLGIPAVESKYSSGRRKPAEFMSQEEWERTRKAS